MECEPSVIGQEGALHIQWRDSSVSFCVYLCVCRRKRLDDIKQRKLGELRLVAGTCWVGGWLTHTFHHLHCYVCCHCVVVCAGGSYHTAT